MTALPNNSAPLKNDAKTCFIVMPISDVDGYEAGHFDRVYKHLIAPACIAAGYIPVRADDVKSTNHIVLDILERIIKSDLVVCDLSAKNPNVMYELGIRQAFDLPVVLLKDKRTDRVFDIQGLRTLDYDESLRIDRNHQDVENLRLTIEATAKPAGHDINSLIRLLSVASASLPVKADISADTAMILKGLNEISQRLTKVEEQSPTQFPSSIWGSTKSTSNRLAKLLEVKLPNGQRVSREEEVYDGNGNSLGTFWASTPDGVLIKDREGEFYSIPPDSELFNRITPVPF